VNDKAALSVARYQRKRDPEAARLQVERASPCTYWRDRDRQQPRCSTGIRRKRKQRD